MCKISGTTLNAIQTSVHLHQIKCHLNMILKSLTISSRDAIHIYEIQVFCLNWCFPIGGPQTGDAKVSNVIFAGLQMLESWRTLV